MITCKTNEGGALKYKLVTCDLAEPNWRSLVAEKEDVLQSVSVFDNNKLILNYMHDCKDELYLVRVSRKRMIFTDMFQVLISLIFH